MKRIRLVVAYDGTHYHGWQIQPGAVTIESVLNEALTQLMREPIQVIGASRTDSGVHSGVMWLFLTPKARCPRIKSVWP